MALEEKKEFDPEEFAPGTVKKKYVPFFQVPKDPWTIRADWDLAYFESAEVIIRGVVEGTLIQGIHGITGIFLFRHYVELALKYIVFHARWLRADGTNAPREEIEELKNMHSLNALWDLAKKDCPAKLGQDAWNTFDTAFIDRVVAEFHRIDPQSDRFRYHGKKFEVAMNAQPVVNELYIDYAAVLAQMKHVHDILSAIDVYLIETHGQNAEWDAEVASW
jgi:hypothetical protein